MFKFQLRWVSFCQRKVTGLAFSVSPSLLFGSTSQWWSPWYVSPSFPASLPRRSAQILTCAMEGAGSVRGLTLCWISSPHVVGRQRFVVYQILLWLRSLGLFSVNTYLKGYVDLMEWICCTLDKHKVQRWTGQVLSQLLLCVCVCFLGVWKDKSCSLAIRNPLRRADLNSNPSLPIPNEAVMITDCIAWL